MSSTCKQVYDDGNSDKNGDDNGDGDVGIADDTDVKNDDDNGDGDVGIADDTDVKNDDGDDDDDDRDLPYLRQTATRVIMFILYLPLAVSSFSVKLGRFGLASKARIILHYSYMYLCAYFFTKTQTFAVFRKHNSNSH